MTLQMIEYFMALADNLSYSRTAEKLHVSQPAVSKYISLLEQELGTELFDRSSRRTVRLTEAGEALAKCFRRCESDYEKTLGQIRSREQLKPIPLNFIDGCIPPEELSARIIRFMGQYPDIHTAQYTAYQNLQNCLDKGELVLCEEQAAPKETGCRWRRIKGFSCSYYLAAKENLPAFGKGRAAAMSDFRGYNLLLPKNMPQRLKEFYRDLTEKYTGQRAEVFPTDGQDATQWFLRYGRGFTLIPEWDQTRADSSLVILRLPEEMHYVIAWKDGAVENPLYREFIDIVSAADADQ